MDPCPSEYVFETLDLRLRLNLRKRLRYGKELFGLIWSQLIPAPRGTGLVASPAVKRLLQLAGVHDAYTQSTGSTKTLENTLKATFQAVVNVYGFLTPNLWSETKLTRSPLEEFADVLRQPKKY